MTRYPAIDAAIATAPLPLRLEHPPHHRRRRHRRCQIVLHSQLPLSSPPMLRLLRGLPERLRMRQPPVDQPLHLRADSLPVARIIHHGSFPARRRPLLPQSPAGQTTWRLFAVRILYQRRCPLRRRRNLVQNARKQIRIFPDRVQRQFLSLRSAFLPIPRRIIHHHVHLYRPRLAALCVTANAGRTSGRRRQFTGWRR